MKRQTFSANGPIATTLLSDSHYRHFALLYECDTMRKEQNQNTLCSLVCLSASELLLHKAAEYLLSEIPSIVHFKFNISSNIVH